MKTQDETPDPRARMIQLIVADLLGEADPAESAEVARALAADPELVQERERLAATVGLVRGLGQDSAGEALSPAATASLGAAAAELAPRASVLPGPGAERRAWYSGSVFRAAAGLVVALGAFALWQGSRQLEQGSVESVARLSREAPELDGNTAAPSAAAPYDRQAGDADGVDQRLAEAPALVGGKLEKSRADEVLLDQEAVAKAGAAGAEQQLSFSSTPLADGPAPEPEVALEAGVVLRDEVRVANLAEPAESSTPSSRFEEGASDDGTYRGPGDSVAAGGGGGPGSPGPGGSSGSVGGALASSRGKKASQADSNLALREQSAGEKTAAREQIEIALKRAGRFPSASSPGPVPHGRVATGSDEFFLGRGEQGGQIDRSQDDAAPDVDLDAGMLDRLRRLGYVADENGAGDREEVDLSRFNLPVYGGNDGIARDSIARRLTPEQRVATIDALLRDCRRRPQEHPRDMFYRWWGDNAFEITGHDHLSTFAVDVDTASYTLARRYLVDGRLPTKAQIRTEEFVNYFKGDVPAPTEGTFAVAAELAPSLFNASPDTWMLRVALRGREVARSERQPLALTFVVDVSGSMKKQNRLELVKHALRLLVGELDANDSVALVAFSNEARLVLPMTSARNRGLIESAIHPLAPQGGTNVQAGLRMGYEAALVGLSPEAHNRVVFLSDGVGNIGETDADALNREVERARDQGIWLNTIGVGMGNHNDAFLEQLANKGDGICNYVDDEREARRALVENFTGAFEPIARDVKIQVDFDPAQVARYRLLGYENRAVADKDFRNDAVDAGEVGSGHQVVALYEVVRSGNGDGDSPLATVRVRWLPPELGGQSGGPPAEPEPAREAAWSVHASGAAGSYAATSAGYRRSVLVGQLAEVLRRSIHARDDSLESLLVESRKLAPELNDPDFDEFVQMIERTIELIAPEWQRYDTLARRLDDLRRVHYRRAQLEDNAVDPGSERFERLDGRARELEQEIRRELDPEAEGLEKTRRR